MRNNLYLILLGAGMLLSVTACRTGAPAKSYSDTFTSGSITLVGDESFAPIVDQELYIFKNDNPDAKPQVNYRSENDAVKALLNDSVRFAFLSRDLSADELKVLKQRNLPVISKEFAIDAVVIIVNQASKDTATSVEEIRKMLKGEAKSDRSIVFDNPNSSLVRYLKDFVGVSNFSQKNIYALKSNKEVIKYVSTHPEAIGITGFTWVDDPGPDYAAEVKNVRVLSIKNENNKAEPNRYFRPSQETLYLKQYPLKRSLYVVNCTGRKGLGTGLELFVEGDKGQRIILRSGLLPVLIPERNITIHSNKL